MQERVLKFVQISVSAGYPRLTCVDRSTTFPVQRLAYSSRSALHASALVSRSLAHLLAVSAASALDLQSSVRGTRKDAFRTVEKESKAGGSGSVRHETRKTE